MLSMKTSVNNFLSGLIAASPYLLILATIPWFFTFSPTTKLFVVIAIGLFLLLNDFLKTLFNIFFCKNQACD